MYPPIHRHAAHVTADAPFLLISQSSLTVARARRYRWAPPAPSRSPRGLRQPASAPARFRSRRTPMAAGTWSGWRRRDTPRPPRFCRRRATRLSGLRGSRSPRRSRRQRRAGSWTSVKAAVSWASATSRTARPRSVPNRLGPLVYGGLSGGHLSLRVDQRAARPTRPGAAAGHRLGQPGRRSRWPANGCVGRAGAGARRYERRHPDPGG